MTICSTVKVRNYSKSLLGNMFISLESEVYNWKHTLRMIKDTYRPLHKSRMDIVPMPARVVAPLHTDIVLQFMYHVLNHACLDKNPANLHVLMTDDKKDSWC